MEFEYPQDFPDNARDSVFRELVRLRRELSASTRECGYPRPTVLYIHLLRAMLAFARIAAGLGWPSHRIDKEARAFLRWLCIHEPSEVGYDYFTGPILLDHMDGSINRATVQSFRRLPEWDEFQNLLLGAGDDKTDTGPPSEPMKDATDSRQCAISAFKSKARLRSIRVTDEMIARAANPGKWNDRTMVTWWKRCDPRCTAAHDKMIRAVLARDPASIWPRK
jgi:hypothetical protein